MADLDEISQMIGGLQADMRRANDWFDKHEEADQRRFEALAEKIDSKLGARVSALELTSAEARGSWKMLTIIGGIVATFGGVIGSVMTRVFGHG